MEAVGVNSKIVKKDQNISRMHELEALVSILRSPVRIMALGIANDESFAVTRAKLIEQITKISS